MVYRDLPLLDVKSRISSGLHYRRSTPIFPRQSNLYSRLPSYLLKISMKLAQPLGLSSGDGLQSGRNSRKSRDRGLVAVAFILLAFFIWRESSERWGVSHWITRHRETLQDFQEKMFQESGLTEPWSEVSKTDMNARTSSNSATEHFAS